VSADALEPTGALERKFPPIVELVVASLAVVVIGGIVMATHVPRRPPMTLPTVLLVVAAVLTGAGAVLLARLQGFAWATWTKVARWALLAYVISSGMIEFAFVKNHTRGAPLAVVTGMLVLFAVNVPIIIATTVARYAER
jgi:uncharacterized membrane protein YoaK (UPF0700 family)